MEGIPFGQYRLLDELGSGGMGEVWRAYDTVTDRIVAIKVLPEHLAQDRGLRPAVPARGASGRETQPPARDSDTHPRGDRRPAVRGHAAGRGPRSADGPEQRAARPGPRSAHRRAGSQGAGRRSQGRAGSPRCQPKPSNILLEDDDFAYLIDFGIARATDETRLTQTGGVIGTLHYMAPESFRHRRRRCASRHLLAGLCVVRVLDRSASLSGRQSRTLDGRASQRTTAAAVSRQARGACGVRCRDRQGMAKIPDERYANTVRVGASGKRCHHNAESPAGHRTAATCPSRRRRGVSDFSADTTAIPPNNSAAATPSEPSKSWWRRKAIAIPAALMVVVLARGHRGGGVRHCTGPSERPRLQATLAFDGLNSSTRH